MGEDIALALSQRAGLTGLADWLDSATRAGLLRSVDPQLKVVQDLGLFQRRIRIQENLVTVAAIGEQATHSIEVPAGEAWRIHWIKILQSDSAGLDYGVFISRLAPVNEFIRIVHRTLPNDEDQSLYPGRQITILQNNNDYSHPEPLEVFGGDTVRVTSDPFATAGRTSRFGIRYELIPPALDFLPGPEWTGAAI